MRKVAALAIAGLLVFGVSACGDVRDEAGTVTQSGSAHSLQIKKGDCVGSLEGDQINDVQLVPCGDPHHWEAYAAHNMPDGDFPGSDEIGKVGQKFCDDEYTKFTGISSDKSQYTWTYLSPTEGSWKDGDREIMCFAGDKAGGIKGSLKDIKK